MTDPVRIVRLLAVMGISLVALTSCIHDNLEECPQAYSVCFRYDYNMEFADRFANEVENLSVYVFDAGGKYLRTFSDEGEALAQTGLPPAAAARSWQIQAGGVGRVERGKFQTLRYAGRYLRSGRPDYLTAMQRRGRSCPRQTPCPALAGNAGDSHRPPTGGGADRHTRTYQGYQHHTRHPATA